MKAPSVMAEISIWSAAIIVMLMMVAASIGFVTAGILAGARSLKGDSNTPQGSDTQAFLRKFRRPR
jgi:hypothetical protein